MVAMHARAASGRSITYPCLLKEIPVRRILGILPLRQPGYVPCCLREDYAEDYACDNAAVNTWLNS